ncbi:hypothetical protein RR48_07820 [Papilio machaon]|uniref:Uncharacterized protein n=1 Tax=Papilio machaon TaxID=76193 RepID=A0A194QZV2_PAPMA|nr:uncharacterized protein LOC106715424 [Papilio machaon]KPJ10814.1 hypothetical protein RR48_07820 [Papilio machaon]
MCEKRTRKIKKGSQLARVREARRTQRLNFLAANTARSNNPNPIPCPAMEARKTAQNRVILELAWKTVALMHKNRLIQQKIIALQKETSEYVAAMMNNPENRRRYMEQICLIDAQRQNIDAIRPIKIEPDE